MNKKNIFIILLLAVGILVFPLPGNFQTFAEQDGGIIFFKDTPLRPAVFDHQKHLAAGNACEACHEKIFTKKKGSTPPMKMKAMRDGKYCGTCHNGTKAFTVKHSCVKCHFGPR